MRLNVYNKCDWSPNTLFDFTDIKNDDLVNCVSIFDQKPYIRCFVANVADIEITNEDVLDPITDSEYEFGVEISNKEIIDRKMKFFRTKANFLKFSKEYGKTIFDKYYKLVEDKTNDNVNYIDKAIDEINDIII